MEYEGVEVTLSCIQVRRYGERAGNAGVRLRDRGVEALLLSHCGCKTRTRCVGTRMYRCISGAVING